MDLRSVEVFVEVVKNESFTKAGRVLGIPASQVSRRLKDLENSLGTVLIERTTRSFKVTEIGEQFYLRCVEGIDHLSAAEDLIEGYKGEPQGELKILGPNELTIFLSKSFLAQFLEDHPKINLHVMQKDRAEVGDYSSFDIVLEVGVTFAPPTFKQKLLTRMKRQLFVSPEYLDNTEREITEPKDIPADDLIGIFSVRGNISATNTQFINQKQGKEHTFPKPKRVSISNLTSMKNLALRGQYIAALPGIVVEDEVKNGRLVSVLPDWSTHEIPILAVYDANRSSNPKVRAFLDDLHQYFVSYDDISSGRNETT